MQQKHCRTVIAGETVNYVEAPLKIWRGKISVICPGAVCAPSSCDLLLSLQIFPHLTGLRAVHPLPSWEVCHMSVEHKECLECHQQDPDMQCIYMEWHYCAGYVRFSQGQKAWKLFQQVQHEGLTELCYFCGCSECICKCRCTRREQACWWKDQPKQLCMWEIALLTWMFWTGSTWCPWRIWLHGAPQPWHMWNVAKGALKCCRLCAAIQHLSFWWQQDLHAFNFRDWQGEWRNKQGSRGLRWIMKCTHLLQMTMNILEWL